MYRHFSTFALDERRTRYRVRIESDPCETEHFKRQMQLSLLANLVNTPDLMNCGPAPFESMRMYHSGGRWIIEFETTLEQA